MSVSRNVDVKSLLFAEIVVMLFSPFLIMLDKNFFREIANTLTMPESSYKIQPFLSAICDVRAVK